MRRPLENTEVIRQEVAGDETSEIIDYRYQDFHISSLYNQWQRCILYMNRNTSGSTVDMPGTLNALGTMSGCSSPGGITRARTPTASATERSSGSSVGGGGSGGLRQSGSSSALSSLSSSNVDIGRTFEQGKKSANKNFEIFN